MQAPGPGLRPRVRRPQVRHLRPPVCPEDRYILAYPCQENLNLSHTSAQHIRPLPPAGPYLGAHQGDSKGDGLCRFFRTELLP